MMLRQIILIGYVLVLITAAGCVSRQVSDKGPQETILIAAGAGDTVTLQWRSDPRAVYTVVYSDKMGGSPNWSVLPSGQNILGTGQMITIKDSAPSAHRRYYRLRVRRQDLK